MAATAVSKEDVRSSKVNFDSFMEDMAMVVTYVPRDETGVMNQSSASSSGSSTPIVTDTQSTAPTTTWPRRNREDSTGQAFHLGAAAIVSSRRTPNASALLVDMDEIQSTLNATFADAPTYPDLSCGPVVNIESEMPVMAPKPIQAPVYEARTATRTSRAAGHSDAPRPVGYPVSIGVRSPLLPPQPSSSDPSISVTKSSTTCSEAASPSEEDRSNTSSPVRSGTPPLVGEGGTDANGRVRARMHSPAPLPSGRQPQSYATFEELLLEPSVGLLKALCSCLQVTEATKTCASVVMVFESKKRTLGMIQMMIEHEVALQKTAATLFRNNSLTTHMMTCYTKIVGLPFLKMIVGPVMLDAFARIDSGEATFEIDPSKMSAGEDLKTNIGDLKRLVHSFFDRILNSRAVMPKNFMEICNSLQSSTVDRFPESRFFVIGGFLFLRYICPAVVAPDGYKLITSAITDKQRRMLVLVSKILQTIANERTFGEKEEYMMCMNPLVNEYQGVVQYFFNQLAKPVMPDTPENVPVVLITPDDYELALKQIISQVKTAKTKLLTNPIITSDSRLLATIENIDNLPLL